MKIYRGISSKYIDKPFIPSGCRESQIEMMIREIDGFVYIDYESIKKSLINKFQNEPVQIIPFYRNASPLSYFNYFLTLLFMNIKLRRNEIIEDYFSFQLDLIPALNGLTKINRRELANYCWEEVHLSFDIKNILFNERFQKSLAVLSYFQHLNHIFENRTPTLCLDWTEDLSIAKRFGDRVISMNIKKFEEYTSYKNWGYTSYKSPINMKNKLMNEQKGYVIFWPWHFKINEICENSFGKAIGFRVEH